ncbi:MAG: hypothetical protein HOY69_38710, partial [Streptomyces sp.]|nr:hypothetical protein [Streptomyces sp.]
MTTTGRRRRRRAPARFSVLRAALAPRRLLVLAALAALTTVLWTTSARATPPAPAPSTTATAQGTAGGGSGTAALSDADKAELAEVQHIGAGTPTDASQQQLIDQATEDLRKQLQQQGGVLGVFNTTDKYGIPLSVYTINPDTGGWNDWSLKVYGFLIELAFMCTKWLVAFGCWSTTWALTFGLAKILLYPVLEVSAALNTQVVVAMGLPLLCITVAGTICAWHILLGDRAKGVGELALTLLIAGIMLTTMASPTTQLMGGDRGGLLGAAQGFSLDVAGVIVASDTAPGAGAPAGGSTVDALARPITDALVDALVVKPAELLEYGQSFDGQCAQAYADAKLQQLAYDQKTDGLIHLIQNNDSVTDWPGMGFLKNTVDPLGLNDWAADKVVGLAGGWVKDHYGHPPMSKFEDSCVTGDVGAAKKASVDKLAGAGFVLLAALIVVLFICRLAGSFLVAQCRVALEAIRGEFVLLAGMIPGGGRTALWQWCATLLRVFQALIMSVVLLAVFLVVVTTLLDPSLDDTFGDSLALRFLVLDIVSIGVFAYRKKVVAAARRSAAGLRSRLDGARIGGAGRAIFRAGPAREPRARRSGAVRAAVVLGALAMSGGTSTTVLGGSRSLARRITPGRRSPGGRPGPRPPGARPGRGTRPGPGGPGGGRPPQPPDGGGGWQHRPPAPPPPAGPDTQAGPGRPPS